LQAIEDISQSLVAYPVHKVEIDARVSKRAAKSKDQCEFLGGEVVAVFQERRWKVVSRFVSKCWVGHRLFGEPLQHFDSNRTVLRRYHRTIVLTWKCYCLNDRDCTSPATEAALVDRGGASMTKRLT
jgi:predicted metal-binding protein